MTSDIIQYQSNVWILILYSILIIAHNHHGRIKARYSSCKDLPLTVSLVEDSALPKEFSATTLYSPVSLDPTLNMSREHTPQVLEIK